MTTPSLSGAVLELVRSQLSGVNISLPARVEKYDAETVSVDVKPLINRRIERDTGEIDHEELCYDDEQHRQPGISNPIHVSDPTKSQHGYGAQPPHDANERLAVG